LPLLLEKLILAAGPGWLVLNKPAGLSVHNDPGGDALSLALSSLENDPALRKTCSWSHSKESMPTPAHRLDRETSGVLLLALTRKRASELQQLMEQRKARKVYRAILRGQLAQAEGSWRMPLSDKAEGRKNPAGAKADQKICATDFRRLQVNQYLSEVELELITGRQHQIRRHACLAKHAIVGDGRYGDLAYNSRLHRIYGTDRLFLHACSLEIEIDQKLQKIEAPVPQEFAKLFAPPAPLGEGI
jgi:23S rRNA-/tRNA-specific pseudouridylate synthase